MSNLSNNFFSVFIFCILLLSIGCSNRPKDVLNEEEMTCFLTDLHKLDGTLQASDVGLTDNLQNTVYYKVLLKNYGITQAQFDSSLVWYTSHPKKFNSIYEEVIVRLTALQTDITKGKYHFIDSTYIGKEKVNLWYLPTKYTFTNDSIRTLLNFNIENTALMVNDTYILRFLQRIAPEDSCTNQHIVFRIEYLNGKKDSVRIPTYNDGLLRRYTIKMPALKKLKIKSLSGSLLASKAYKGSFNAHVDSITLMRVFNPSLQDSLRKVVEKFDSIRYQTPAQVAADSTRKSKLLRRKLHILTPKTPDE
jgi:hypothetical protein